MNKKIITLLLAAAVSLTLASCTPKQNNDVQPGKDNPQNAENTTTALDPDLSHYHLVTRENPYTIESMDKSETYIQAKITSASFVALERTNSPYAKEMNKTLEQAFDRHESAKNGLIDMLDGIITDDSTENVTFPWRLETSYELARNDGRAISLLENVYYFAGGTHPSQTTFTYNFDPATGKQIEQVFYDGGDDERDEADNRLYNMLVSKYGEENISYDYISSSFVETFTDCWYFTQDGIKVVIGAGDIAPLAAGAFELEIAKEELAQSAQKYFN